MRATWYLLDDGEPGDPALIAPGEDGLLRHQDGRAVAYGPHGPKSTGVDVPDATADDEEKTVEPEKPRRTYKTREMKA